MLMFCNWHNCLLLIGLLIVSSIDVFGQEISVGDKKRLINASRQELIDTLNKQTHIDYPFIIGTYHRQVFDKSNHPYIDVNEWESGSLVYNSHTYAVENLKYDIETDNLIYLLVVDNSLANIIALDKNAISEFSLSNKIFRYYQNLKTRRGKKVKDGYYEVAFDGKLKFLIRREKTQMVNNTYNYLRYSNVLVSMYLLNGNELIAINSLGMLINQFNSQYRDAVKAFVKKKHLSISQTKYSSALLVLKYYENLQGQ